MATCKHKICGAIDDGECHVEDGWVVGITREQYIGIVVPTIGVPALGHRHGGTWDAELTESMDYGMRVLESTREILTRPGLSKADRRRCEQLIERLRERGLPRDGWRAH